MRVRHPGQYFWRSTKPLQSKGSLSASVVTNTAAKALKDGREARFKPESGYMRPQRSQHPSVSVCVVTPCAAEIVGCWPKGKHGHHRSCYVGRPERQTTRSSRMKSQKGPSRSPSTCGSTSIAANRSRTPSQYRSMASRAL